MKKEYFKPTQKVVELKNQKLLQDGSIRTFSSFKTNLSATDDLEFGGGGYYEAR